MKPEIEYKWLISLLASDYAKRDTGCKTDFNNAVGVSTKNPGFRKFFNQLIKEGCIEFAEEKITRGGKVNFYFVNFKNMKQKIETYDIWKKTVKIADRKDIYGYH